MYFVALFISLDYDSLLSCKSALSEYDNSSDFEAEYLIDYILPIG